MSIEPAIDIQALIKRALRRQVRLPEFSQPVYIESAQPFDDLISLTVRTRDGLTSQTIIQADALTEILEQAAAEDATSALASPSDLFLLVEAARIRLAYSFDPFFAVSLSGVQALRNRVVWDSVQLGKIVSLTRMNEQTPIERQFYRASEIVVGFFSYYNWTHLWSEQVVRQAIAQGIKNRTFAYVANARTNEQGNLVLSGSASTTIFFGRDVPSQELDMSENAFLLSAAYAQQLLIPPAQPQPPVDLTPPSPAPTPVSLTSENSGGSLGSIGSSVKDGGAIYTPPPTPSPGSPVTPGKGGQHYRLHVQIRANQFFDLIQALERLNDRSMSMDVTVIATAKPNQPFVANTMHNLIGEPLIETSDIQVLEERVEE